MDTALVGIIVTTVGTVAVALIGGFVTLRSRQPPPPVAFPDEALDIEGRSDVQILLRSLRDLDEELNAAHQQIAALLAENHRLKALL